MTNASNNGRFTPICCLSDELDPADSFCSRNDTFSMWTIFATLFSNVSIAVVKRELTCNGTIFDLESYPPNNDVFSLRENGSIDVTKSMYAGTMEFMVDTAYYCFTSRLTENGRKAVISVCDPKIVLVPAIDLSAVERQIGLIAVGLSLPCLAATFFVYTILLELKNVPGFTLRAYVATLFVYFTLYLIMMRHLEFFCYYLLAFILHFTIIAHFFWLNIMCFDIWWTFRRVRSVQSESKHGNRKRCIIYSIFAWGSSALITGVGAIIDSVPTVPKGIIRPGLRADCWFVKSAPALVYWIGPIGLTMICNMGFFVLTAITLIRHEKDTANRLNGNEEKLHNKEKKRFHLYLKLFIIMGTAWIAEVINWQWAETYPSYIAVILDIPSSLQGLFIFVIFVCKKKTKNLLLKRLGWGEKKSSAVNCPVPTQ